uniref:Uncharacterized protein n=1 Tax=Setaria viridis TaxID=4556 RepID=A0A4U6UN06_SETVI|nr:hypothetical protein SEVIR_5G308150v2 [Setaria viridis]
MTMLLWLSDLFVSSPPVATAAGDATTMMSATASSASFPSAFFLMHRR